MNQQNDVKNLQNIIETSIEATLSQFDEETIDIYLPDEYVNFLDPNYASEERYSFNLVGDYKSLERFNHYYGLVYNNLQQRIEEYRLMKNLDPYYVNDCVLQIMSNYQNRLYRFKSNYDRTRFQLYHQYRVGMIDRITLNNRLFEALCADC